MILYTELDKILIYMVHIVKTNLATMIMFKSNEKSYLLALDLLRRHLEFRGGACALTKLVT